MEIDAVNHIMHVEPLHDEIQIINLRTVELPLNCKRMFPSFLRLGGHFGVVEPVTFSSVVFGGGHVPVARGHPLLAKKENLFHWFCSCFVYYYIMM